MGANRLPCEAGLLQLLEVASSGESGFWYRSRVKE